jgi:hypothetical protein
VPETVIERTAPSSPWRTRDAVRSAVAGVSFSSVAFGPSAQRSIALLSWRRRCV